MGLRKEYRDHLLVMSDLAQDIEAKLDSKVYDRLEALPLGEARKHAGRLKAWLSELCYLTEEK